jgi:hypothetical protein
VNRYWRRDSHKEKKMRTSRSVLLTIAAGAALAATASAFADGWEHERGYGGDGRLVGTAVGAVLGGMIGGRL